MPDKQNESKFMAMLERRGIVRKADIEAESMDADPDGASERALAEADLRSIFDPHTGEAIKVTPSARQPVPGMAGYDILSERSQQAEREQAKSTRRFEPEPSKRAETSKAVPFYGDIDFDDDIPADAQSASGSVGVPSTYGASSPSNAPRTPGAPFTPYAPAAFERSPEPPSIESYTDKYLDIEELYEVLALKLKRTDTIYLIEEYIKTLPESLPDESRREIVSKIVAASGFDFDLLIGDGVLRMKTLKEYAERFAKYTDDFVSARNAEVDELEGQILRIRRMIENRRELHKKQFFVIEAEAQRLKEILTFISG